MSSPTAHGPVVCAHCGLPAAETESESADGLIFCCSACATAYAIINTHGLSAYHRFPERRGAAVRPSNRAFSDFDHDAFAERYVKVGADGLAHVELALEGVRCASCVWLIERVPLLVTGVARAELDVRQSRASVTWDMSAVALSDIARTLDALGYTPHPWRGGERAALRRLDDRAMLVRIGVAGAIATNAMLLALAIYAGDFATMDRGSMQLFRWLSLMLTIPTLIWPGRIFFTSAIAALRARTVHMDVPIAFALFAATTRGTINTISGSGPIYFDGVCVLVFLLLVGRFLQARGQRAATDATEQLFALTPATAHLVADDGMLRDVPADAVAIGAVIAVRAGETIPVDGEVIAGSSRLNRAVLTGESAEVHVDVGDTVYAGTLNRSSELRISVKATGDDSRLARILAQIDESARRRAPVVLLADRLASRLVIVVLSLAVATFFIWLRKGNPTAAWDNTIALLIATCPCALALATPLAMSAAIGRAARTGIFIKGGDTLESLSRPGWMVLDKTGTLTVGETTLLNWRGDDAIRPWILALEATSTHPIAAGFRRAWPTTAASVGLQATHTIGGGIVGELDGHHLAIGSPRFIAAQHPEAFWPAWSATDGNTPVIVAVDGRIVARAGFGDAIRPDALSALTTLRARGWRTLLLTGDESAISHRVGAALGFARDEIVAEASPEEKALRVRRLVESMSGGATPPCVVMVGDGVNDAAAIAAATVGVGVHGGAEASLATADIAMTRDGLAALVALDTGARRTMRVIRRNIRYAFAYNTVGVLLAMTGHITPLVAAVLMPVSSLTVVLCSWFSTTFTAETT
jgi:P-type Cu2+ transporter